MTVHEEYTKLIQERYSGVDRNNYEQYGYYLAIYHAPAQYMTEASMLSYAKRNPNATAKELFDYFNKITPDGLAPGDDGADLLEDD